MEGEGPTADCAKGAVDIDVDVDGEGWWKAGFAIATSVEARRVRSSSWMPCQVLWSMRAPCTSETRVSCGRDSSDIPSSVARTVAICRVVEADHGWGEWGRFKGGWFRIDVLGRTR